MKSIIKKFSDFNEIFDPIKDFYSMRHNYKREIVLLMLTPIILGILFLVFCFLLHTKRNFILDDFFNDLVNQFITMLTLFISFSMAYLSIIITSSSKNIDNLKRSESKYKLKNEKENCTVYQAVACEITYSVVIEICFLILAIFEKFLFFMLSDWMVKALITINIILFVHIILVLMITVKDIYYTFWKSI